MGWFSEVIATMDDLSSAESCEELQGYLYAKPCRRPNLRVARIWRREGLKVP
jgi:hypothetical protein